MAPKRILQSFSCTDTYNHIVKRVKYFEEFNPEEEQEDDDEDPEEEFQEEEIINSEAKDKADGEELWSKYPRLNESLKLKQFSEYTLPDSGTNCVKESLSCIGNLKAKELEDKWKKLQAAETEVKLMRANLIQQQTQLILDLIS
uniref:Uncharacterized protein n=1 Tax=Manihot esculenta TaxID=3983 RepID=A0A2C9VLL8_MANES